jgi:hypothetical protein
MITAESRDFTVATYSVASLTGTARASSTFTGMACIPPACGFGAAFPEHPNIPALAAKTKASKLPAAYPSKRFAINNLYATRSLVL